MAIQNLIRWSGVALLLGGMSSALSALFHPNNHALNAVFDRLWAPTHVGEGLAFLLIVLGLVGLHLRQAEKAGRLGLIGFILALFGSAATVNEAMLYEAYILPYVAAQQAATKSALDIIDPAGPLAGALPVSMAGLVAFTIGITLTSIVTMRAGVLPRWPGWLLIAGLLLSGVGWLVPGLWFILNISGLVFGLGLAWLGYALWSERGETVEQLRPPG